MFEVETEGGLNLGLTWDVQIGAGLDKATGPFLVVNEGADKEIELGATVELVDGTELSLELFFLELTASQAAGDATGLTGFIDLDIVDADDDGMIPFSEFDDLSFDDRFDLEMGVNAIVNLDLDAGLAVEVFQSLEPISSSIGNSTLIPAIPNRSLAR